jgi:hypothetical protein
LIRDPRSPPRIACILFTPRAFLGAVPVRGAGNSSVPDDAGRTDGESDVGFTVLAGERKAGRPASLAPRLPSVLVARDHHPCRFLELVPNYLSAMRGHAEIDEGVRAWAQGRPLHPLDRDLLSISEPFQGSFFFASEIGRLTGTSHDVGALARRWSGRDASAAAWDPSLSGDTLYLHFGAHAFPSPFLGLGVEGCYVESYQAGPGTPEHVAMRFTVTPDLAPGGGPIPEDSLDVRMRNLIRGYEIGFSPARGERVGAALSSNPANYPDAYAAAWRPYLGAVVNAAWHGYVAVRCGLHPHRDALPHGTSPSLAESYARASTEGERRDLAVRIAAGRGRLVLRYLGRAPARSGVRTEWDQATYPCPGSPEPRYAEEACEAALADAQEGACPETLLAHADRVLAQVILGQATGAACPAATRHRIRAQSIRIQALKASGDDEIALVTLRGLLTGLEDDPEGVIPPLSGLLVEAGDERASRDVVESFCADVPSRADSAWAAALVEARFGRPEIRDFATAHAVSLCPEAARATLASIAQAEAGKPARPPASSAERIALLSHRAWAAVPGGRALLSACLRARSPTVQ